MDSRQAQAPDLAAGDVLAGKFRLEREIGRGGMGSVWAARHVQLDMPVALMFIETENDHGPPLDMPDARARFEREARAAGQIRSPHVVSIIDHGIDQAGGRDRPYIAMELLEGEDLGERLRREGRISVAAAARILSQAAKALRRAHDAGIIHRDLKPGNIFLSRVDDEEIVKILDFGVAKMRRSGVLEEQLMTQTGIVFGSPSYMSPEQARGARAIDHRSDLWSLAVILFRAVTGVKPFQASSIADLVIKLCIDPLPVATQVAPDLPPALDGFFARAFARDPEQRFASAVEMAAAFEAAASASAPAAGWPRDGGGAPPHRRRGFELRGRGDTGAPRGPPCRPGERPARRVRAGDSHAAAGPAGADAAVRRVGASLRRVADRPAAALPSGAIGGGTIGPGARAVRAGPATRRGAPARGDARRERGDGAVAAGARREPGAAGAARAAEHPGADAGAIAGHPGDEPRRGSDPRRRARRGRPAQPAGGGVDGGDARERGHDGVSSRRSRPPIPRPIRCPMVASAAIPTTIAEPEPSVTANGATVAEPAPEPSGSAAAEPPPAASASAAPRAPVRSGRKKKPNFGY